MEGGGNSPACINLISADDISALTLARRLVLHLSVNEWERFDFLVICNVATKQEIAF